MRDFSDIFYRVTVGRAASAVWLLSCVAAFSAHAQAQIYQNARPQREDLDEVEDVDGSGKPNSDARRGSLELLQAEELSYSPSEIRGRYQYFGAIALGPTKPWHNYEIEWGAFWNENFFISGHAGGGRYRESGSLDDQAYDLSVGSRSFGVSFRQFVPLFEHLSIDATWDMVMWEGRIDPHGVNDGESANTNQLSSAFRLDGMSLGVGAVLTWLWDRGFYVEWAPVGARISKILRRDYSRESDAVERIVARSIERPAFYGLVNIKAGYLF